MVERRREVNGTGPVAPVRKPYLDVVQGKEVIRLRQLHFSEFAGGESVNRWKMHRDGHS